jgi:hypothetical protein
VTKIPGKGDESLSSRRVKIEVKSSIGEEEGDKK